MKTTDDINQQAYNDVLEEREPQQQSEEYLRKYAFWLSIANRPEDRLEDFL